MRVSEKRWKNAHIMPGERDRQRLSEQARERAREHLSSMLSEEERNEVLTEVIEEALREVVKACPGIFDGKSVAEVILATTPTGS